MRRKRDDSAILRISFVAGGLCVCVCFDDKDAFDYVVHVAPSESEWADGGWKEGGGKDRETSSKITSQTNQKSRE